MKKLTAFILVCGLEASAEKLIGEVAVAGRQPVTFKFFEGSKKNKARITRSAKGKIHTRQLSNAEFAYVYDDLMRTVWTSSKRQLPNTENCTKFLKIEVRLQSTEVCAENRKATKQASSLVNRLDSAFR